MAKQKKVMLKYKCHINITINEPNQISLNKIKNYPKLCMYKQSINYYIIFSNDYSISLCEVFQN
jgi:hypothetical protein